MIKRTYKYTDIQKMFQDILYSSDGEFVILCAFNNGIYVDVDKNPSKEKINSAREAVLSLFCIAFDLIECVDGVPVVAYMASFDKAMTELYIKIMDTGSRDYGETLLYAFFYRITHYLVEQLYEELFYDEPIEVISVIDDRDSED